MGCLVISAISGMLFLYDIITLNIFMLAVIGSIIWMYIAVALYFKFGFLKFFYHGLLGWHRPDGFKVLSDGCSDHYRCKYCGKSIMQDSQGNWFAFD